MKRKTLEIYLEQHVHSFSKPKVALEQYVTSAELASLIIHRAYTLGDIAEKEILDLCAGTGIFGISASLLGASTVTFVEIDPDAAIDLQGNLDETGLNNTKLIIKDALNWDPEVQFDTVFLNPPFGIQQKVHRDVEFLEKAYSISKVVYSIHDGNSSLEFFHRFAKLHGFELTEYYKGEFKLPKIFNFQQKSVLKLPVIILRSMQVK